MIEQAYYHLCYTNSPQSQHLLQSCNKNWALLFLQSQLKISIIIYEQLSMSSLPKLEDSLFFKKQIMGNLINEIEMAPLQQNLLLDPTILDSLSSNVIISKQLKQTVIIDYQDIVEGSDNINTTFTICIQKEQRKQVEQQTKLYFRRENIELIIDSLNYIHKINSISYLTCFEASILDSNTIYRNCYKLQNNGQSIKVIPQQQLDISFFNHILIENSRFLNFQIRAIYLALPQKQKHPIINILLQSNTKQLVKYTIQQIFPTEKLSQTIGFKSNSLLTILTQNFCFTEQINFLQPQITITSQINFSEDYSYVWQMLADKQVKMNNLNMDNIVSIMKTMEYFYQELNLCIGSIQIATIGNGKQQIALFTDFRHTRIASIELFTYDIVSLINQILDTGSQMLVKVEDEIVELMEDIVSTGNPVQCISKFKELIESMKKQQC